MECGLRRSHVSWGNRSLRLADLVAPEGGTQAQSVGVKLKVSEASGLPDEIVGQELSVRYRYPDRLRLEAEVSEKHYMVGRDQDEIWFHAPEKQLTVVGQDDVPRFTGYPQSVQAVDLKDFALPVSRWQLKVLPAAVSAYWDKDEPDGIRFEIRGWARDWFGLPAVSGRLELNGEGLPENVKIDHEGDSTGA